WQRRNLHCARFGLLYKRAVEALQQLLTLPLNRRFITHVKVKPTALHAEMDHLEPDRVTIFTYTMMGQETSWVFRITVLDKVDLSFAKLRNEFTKHAGLLL